METNKIYCMDCLEGMKQLEDYSVDIIVTDPPYALGSEVIIRPDGKPDYSKATDFMNKWTQPDGKFWEEWFKEAYRVLKYGGRVIMFGMDRQCFVNKYYACASGFTETQSIYWFFISNFPKSADLSKNIDKHFGAEREVIGKADYTMPKADNSMAESSYGISGGKLANGTTAERITADITTPSTDLAKKYSGFKYSIAPLKQTCETIMVFAKPYKTGSCLHDTLAYENGDNECLCGALDIDLNRVPIENEIIPRLNKAYVRKGDNNFGGGKDQRQGTITGEESSGRYPAQTYINSETAKILDKQSGITKSSIGSFKSEDYETKECVGNFKRGDFQGKGDTGGCSRILHKCDYDSKDFDLFIYEPKVDTAERNMCMEDEEYMDGGHYAQDEWSRNHMGNTPDNQRKPVKNNHPTLKPISLMTKILKLFKTPNKQLILDPFAGSGSTLISAKHLGIDWIGFEIDADYVRIAKARMSQSTMLGWIEDV